MFAYFFFSRLELGHSLLQKTGLQIYLLAQREQGNDKRKLITNLMLDNLVTYRQPLGKFSSLLVSYHNLIKKEISCSH